MPSVFVTETGCKLWPGVLIGILRLTVPLARENGQRLTLSLVDQGVRLERSPGEPEMVAVDYLGQPLASQRAADGLSQDIPGGAGFGVGEPAVGGAES